MQEHPSSKIKQDPKDQTHPKLSVPVVVKIVVGVHLREYLFFFNLPKKEL